MAVYTQLEFDEIAMLVAPLGLGQLTAAQGVAAGVENTTYFLTFTSDNPEDDKAQFIAQYVLTIAETLSDKDLEFVARLMRDLSMHALPVPSPVFQNGNGLLSIRGKPALVVPKIAGSHPESVTPYLCRQVGCTLAKLHLTTLDLHYRHESHRSLNWVIATGKTLLPQIAAADRVLLEAELTALSEFVSTSSLPEAIIHGDLFRDNVLIDDHSIAALIDFFSAGTGYLLLDLAITVNDWCFDSAGKLDLENYSELIAGYCAIRKPETEEIKNWSQLLRIAALRFWVSRLNEQIIASPHAPGGRGKDPAPYRRLIIRHRDKPLSLKY
jgi:homoserine kinase type II